jgi:zinc/manganese transport system substrate-binding protein
MIRFKHNILYFIVAVGLLTTTCNAKELTIVSLHSIITELTKDVGGDKVNVISFIKPDTDPHTFEPSALNLRAASSADLIIASGLGIESYINKIVTNTSTHAKVISLGEEINATLLSQNQDPHWWQSIDCVIVATRIIEKSLSSLSPVDRIYFRNRANIKIIDLIKLKAWARTTISQIPLDRRDLVTSHDAFGRFAQDFNFRIHPIAGLSPESEPNAKDIAQLIDFIKKARIKTIFVENRINPKITEGIIHDTDTILGGVLYSDGLGSKECQTYASMYRHNVNTIVDGLK